MDKNVYKRGSEWRKWDLHIHTSFSYDWDNSCKDSVKDILEKAILANISVIAITDHHTVQGVDEVISIAKGKNITVLPGVELRTDKGNKGIHIIGIFDSLITAQTIYDKLLCPLNFSKNDINTKGNEAIYCNFEEACQKIHDLGGLVLLHAGNKSNGIEQLDSDIRATLKRDLASLVDIFEVSTKKQIEDYRNIVFPKIKQEFPCVITSDACDRSKLQYKAGHSTEVMGKKYSWIKADPTFEGLKTIINEPNVRVCVDDVPTKIKDVENNKTKYINSIKINHEDPQKTPVWFDNVIPLNSGLVAIIGKKGSGKSALVDIIALAGKSFIPKETFSFLKKDKFLKSPQAKHYKAELEWADEKVDTINLIDQIDPSKEYEKVKYLPQKYVETICSEDGVSILFQKEINKLIFSYIPLLDRENTSSLEEFFSERTKIINKTIQELYNRLDDKIQELINLEIKVKPSYLESLEEKKKEKLRDLSALKAPTEVDKPAKEIDKAIELKIQKIKDDIQKKEDEILKSNQDLKSIKDKLSKIKALQDTIQALKDYHVALREDLKVNIEFLGLNFDNIFNFKIDELSINALKAKLDTEKNVIVKRLGLDMDLPEEDKGKDLISQKNSLENELEVINKELDKDNKAYQKYEQEKKKYENRIKEINGSENDKSLETIKSIDLEITYVKNYLKNDLQSIRKEIENSSKEVYKCLNKKKEELDYIYKPLKLIQKTKQGKSDNILNFDVGIVFNKKKFSIDFLSMINQNKDGSFQGKEDGENILKSIINKFDFTNEKDIILFINSILDSLNHDQTEEGLPLKILEEQLLKGVLGKAQLYKLLYKLDYLDVKYRVLFDSKDLNENTFSPGEKGAILLIFYLLFDKDKSPLIIDQPEENLDNESVFNLLVPYIKEAKKVRQIIIVTHNPNIAVVCDADQIIYATMDKQSNEIRYTSGSIENPETNKHIINVLEGTMPAFSKREQKYIR